MLMRKGLATLVLFATFSSFSFATNSTYPTGPDMNLTPGQLCQHASSYRYPEHIPYCVRNVSKSTKDHVIAEYNQLGFNILASERSQFKIDHLIPLCAGGANDASNLWPQHKTVYDITDPMEPLACDKMAKGVLTQAHAIELIMKGKTHLDQVPAVLAEMQAL